MKLTKQQEMRAMGAYNAYWDNYLKGDVDAMASLLSSKYTQVGSAETEVFSNKKDAVKFLYDTIDQVAGKLEIRNRNVKLEKQSNFLLFHELCDLYALAEHGWIFYSKFRATTIMEEKKHGWKIIHQHSSFPDARTGDGENIAIDKIAEENRELREAVKRRTIELEQKNRELEIESALEKVRSSALAMNAPADMLDVCRIISDQLQLLNVKDIRNIQTAIINEAKGIYLNYEYFTQYKTTSLLEIEIKLHPVVIEFVNEIKKSNDAFFTKTFEGEALKDWREYRRKTNQIADPILDEAKSVHYYFYSIGPGALGVSTYVPLSEEDIAVFKRFRNVFELAYRRFVDIEQAIAQAKEAKIEASLEKVRASAMSMHKSDDLLDVCEILYKELNKLGFDEMRNAMINIHNDEEETFINFDYSDEIGRSINHLTYNIHPVIEKQIKQIRNTNDAFSETSFTGKDLEEWKKFRRKIGEKDDQRINNISALYYYFYSIGAGSIGISTFNSINEEKLTLLKRFRNVFSLAYQRYSDIALAEAQAREAQIELALERVRARTMAMQKSEELKEVIRVVYDQFVHLKINIDHAGFVVDYTPKGDWHFWIADEQDIPSKITHPYFESVWASQFNEAKEKGTDFFTTKLNFEEKNKFYNELLSYVPGLPKASKDFYLSCPGLAASTALFDNVSLYIENFSSIPYTDEENNTLMRFGKVFQQTYTRFLDLQKAEAQAREAQIEASLEKVRSVAMSMNKSEDLLSICEVSFKEFKKLGFDNIRNALIHIQYDEKKYFMDYDFSDLTGGAITKIEYGSHPVVEDYLEQIRSAKDAFYQGVIKEDQLEEWKDFRRSSGQFDDPRLDKATALYYYFFSIGIGDIGLSTFKPIDESQIKILKRFRNVFDLAYRRFNDIALAEQQARETQIQLALERVRARTMAMHKSDELADTVFVLFQQFKELGIEPKMLTIGIMNDLERVIEFWVTDWSGSGSKVNRKFKASIEEPILLSKIYACWKEQKKSIEIELSNKELQAWIDYRVKLSEIPDEKDYSTSKGYVVAANFSKGILSISSYEPQTPETVQLLERFAGVFDLTYTRFFDLQKAEAQAREAKIEASLEKVRSKTMAMQSSDELADTAAVVFQQLINLGIEPNRIYITIIKDETGICEFWITDEDGSKVSSAFRANLNENHSFEKMYEGWKQNKKSISIDMRGEELQEYFRHLSKLSVPFKDGLSQKRRMQYIAYFSKGFIGVASPDETKSETIQLLERFAAVFNLTYTRFNDLKQAEAQNKIIQAENERKSKELEEARQLQLAMLPKSIPEIPNLDIAVYMKTATEVGGDYYDFKVQENGVLNIGIGDATGHGLQAGTMITLMKGFFTSDVARFNPQKFLEHCNGMIRDIKLGRILMSFSHLRFNNNSLLISSAGMPPIYYHHEKNNRTEEIIIQGLPLGAMGSASYKLVEKQLNSGDTILLLTDGLPEQMNSHKVIFDYSRVLKYFDEIAENTPNEITNRLVQKADEWMDGLQQSDDITFVVIKVK